MTEPDILAQARAALNGTTEGPWAVQEDTRTDGTDMYRFGAWHGHGMYATLGDLFWIERDEHSNPADARFIAWARDGVPALVAEVERLRRGGRELGRMVKHLSDDHLAAIGEELGGDLIDTDGDGHWDAVHERLMALRPERDAARAEVEQLRAREKALADRIDALRDQIGYEVRSREEWEANENRTSAEAERAWSACAENERLADLLQAQIAAVRDVHRPVEIEPSDTICGECSNLMPNGRYLPLVDWPCPTIRALDGEATDG